MARLLRHSIFLIIFIFFCVSLSPALYSAEGSKEMAYQKKLDVTVNMRASWEHDWPKGKRSGNYSVTIQGRLELDNKWSSQAHIGNPVLAAYRIGSLRANYNYRDVEVDKDPPGDCKGPDAAIVMRAEGNGSASLPSMPGGAPVLQVNYMRSQLNSAMEGLSGTEASMAAGLLSQLNQLKDFYIFTLPAAKEKVLGISRRSDCSHQKLERTISVLPLTLTLPLGDDGEMAGSRRWSSTFSAGPDFNFRIRELPQEQGKTKNFIKPKHDGLPGSINYTLSWNIEPPAPVQIQRKINNKWADLSTNQTYRTVLIGEKVELRAISLPGRKVVGNTSWKIDGNPGPQERNFIKRFEGKPDSGKVIHLDSNDFKQSRLTFYWYRGHDGIVACEATVGGQRYRVSETSDIQEPDYNVTYLAREDSTFGPIDEHLLKDEELINGFPTDNLIQQGITGLQYNGIRFEAHNSSSDRPGATQWVQLAREKQRGENDTGAHVKMDEVSGLDSGSYPSGTGPVFVDAPGIPVDNITDPRRLVSCMDIDFKTFVMYRPKSRYGEPDNSHMWVPVNKITWGWDGCVIKSAGVWQKLSSSEPIGGAGEKPEPEITEATEYPTWSGNTR